MPRFKATPQQFNLDNKHESSNDGVDDVEGDMSSSNVDEHSDHKNDDSNGEYDEDSSQEDQVDSVIESDTNHTNLKRPPDTDENSLKRKLRKTNQNSVESVPVTTECLNNFETAAFLAQAAAVATVAALSSGQLIPIFPSETPPIAPLGLSLPPIPNGNFAAAITTIVTTKTTEAPNNSVSTRSKANFLSTNTINTTKQQSPNVSISGLSSNNNDTAATDDDYGGIDEEGEDNTADDENFHQCKSREREKQFINCPVCCKTMRRGSLREHMDRHANSGKFKCDVCEKTFSRASAREKHLRTHTGERPYKCELCSKAYRQKVHLNEHLRSHTGVRPYLCKLCGFCLASKSLLNRHLRTHGIRKNLDNDTDVWMKIDAPKDEVLNIAAEVGRVLSQTENENLNIKNDTTINGDSSNNIQLPKNERLLNNSFATEFVLQLKPKGSVTFGRKYLCNICPAGFPTVQALRSHRMTTHNVVTPHKCPQCDDSFSSLKLMEGHLRKLHPQVI
ncbi:Zinc finger protein [Schistosoma japonicum]|uniref:Zinc finger protein n=1 Tax=Schistosoma japonicum TaxID=6182 RepID=A0A4Z2DFE8_SCHJA|nr:Zinc finger protein [Schistosoma japonicum]